MKWRWKILYSLLLCAIALGIGVTIIVVTFIAHIPADHIIRFVPEDAMVYFHDRDGSALSFFKDTFPDHDRFFVPNQTTSVIVNAWGDIIIARYTNGNIVIESKNKDAVTAMQEQFTKNIQRNSLFQHKNVGNVIRQAQLKLFPVYGIITDRFEEDVLKQIPALAELGQNNTWFFLADGIPRKSLQRFDSDANSGMRFQWRPNLGLAHPWGFSKTQDSILFARSPIFFVAPVDMETLERNTDSLSPFAEIPRLIQEDFPHLAAAQSFTIYEENGQYFWLITWAQEYNSDVELLAQKLAQAAFPQVTASAQVLPDGETYTTFVPANTPFPSQDTFPGVFLLKHYKKDTWELHILASPEIVALTNMSDPMRSFSLSEEKVWKFPACGQAETTFYDRRNSDYSIYILRNQVKPKIFGCFWK